MYAAQTDLITAISTPSDGTSPDRRHAGIELYHLLSGCDPVDADVRDDDNFDRHVLASVLCAAVMDGGSLPDRAGLTVEQLNELLAKCFPFAPVRVTVSMQKAGSASDEEIMVRDLLLAQRSTKGEISRWLAAMIARRAMEPNHLWEDLGLRERAELSRLLARHFAPLAAQNAKNMRWKRFFYRRLCEDEGWAMCTTPVCAECIDFNHCFGEESGESRMAERSSDHLREFKSHVEASGSPQA
ncbi:nitrogen fixation protein NifQ [Bradyrhizobium sp. CCGB01]|uniref:nitrogen fixation protein NifQ n=1 Tax=Bradyrhizobium sp. CCGB01 TaxID=2949634 RepID=UPI0020B36625|nr:nitrogen fixation protein NifQ [Bradyrhizobium sp. CCGB01]MCP3405540.1 nitrogen fixation protein NifQ [Bradyrhizobium sp. CCGB01]